MSLLRRLQLQTWLLQEAGGEGSKEFEVRPIAGRLGDNDNRAEPQVETAKSLKPVRVA